MNLVELDKKFLWHPFTQMAEWEPLLITRGEGSFLIDTNGKRYLDAIGSLWCNVHGHNREELNLALVDQLHRVAHSTFLGLAHEPGILLARDLIEVAPPGLSRVFYSDSGSTAVEVALKQSFQYWQQVGRPRKQRFLHLAESYHGDTIGTVSVGGIELFHRIFGPLLVQSISIPTPAGTDGTVALERLEQELSHRAYEIAAFVIEPRIQGAAGMLVHPKRFLSRVAELCRHFEVHLIVDEVATGFGRTGDLFACEDEAVSPDFLCLAKGITGGYLPLAATLTTETIFQAFLGRREENRHFFHGHTYTANPLACAVARKSLELLRKSTLEQIRGHIPELQVAAHRFQHHPLVSDVRFCGAMIGIELKEQAARVCSRARAHGVLLRPLGEVIVWMPPLTISSEEIDLLERATCAALDEVM
jgi:adenosylmethionine-8-amino-7-oxononanoate aminotransferase